MVGVVLALGVYSAQAQGRLASEDEWFVECPVDRLAGTSDCEVAIELKDKDLSSRFGFIYRLTSGTFLAVGLPGRSSISAQVDDGEAYDFTMCTGQACLLRGRVATQLRESMQKGEIIRLEFRSGTRPSSATELRLAGFKKMHIEAVGRLGR